MSGSIVIAAHNNAAELSMQQSARSESRRIIHGRRARPLKLALDSSVRPVGYAMTKNSRFLLFVFLAYMLSATVGQSNGLDPHFQHPPGGDAAKKLAKISGKVFDAEGKPAFQMEIRLVKAEDVDAEPEAVFAEERRFSYIGQDGNYELQWVPPGRYILAVNADFRFAYSVTFYPDTQEVARTTVITVEPAEDLNNVDVSLPAPTLTRRVVGGTVTYADGYPVANAWVTLLLSKYPWIAPSAATTDAEGHFSVTGFEGITYLLHAWVGVGSDQQMHAAPSKVQFQSGMEPITVAMTLPGKGLPIQRKK